MNATATERPHRPTLEEQEAFYAGEDGYSPPTLHTMHLRVNALEKRLAELEARLVPGLAPKHQRPAGDTAWQAATGEAENEE